MLTANNSMNDYISKAVKRYSSLFMLPPHKKLFIGLFAVCLFNGILISAALQFSSPYLQVYGLALGTVLFLLGLVSDGVIWFNSRKTDPVFNLRRCSALTLYSTLLWFVFIFVGVTLSQFYNDVWFKFFLLGFCVSLALRLLVFSAVSLAGVGKATLFSFLLPVLHTIPVVYVASAVNVFSLDAYLLFFFFLTVVATIATMLVFIFSINRVGMEILGVDSFAVLKAFMANWTEDQTAPFEHLFERFSQERDIQLSALAFRNLKGVVKAMMVVPTFHPGPFKNVGSSALPYMIQNVLENKLQHCCVSVPHGLSGHDLDLATQSQNQLVIEKALRLSEISNFGTSATPFIRIRRNGTSVGCQVFNDCTFVTLTLAPETMEDLPPELNASIIEAAKENGFATAMGVDAHNSIQGSFDIDEAIEPLREAALTILERASKLHPVNFQVGVARVKPKEFGLEEGMGQGGITALVIRTGDQTIAYITIDGNNMISGLRERILSALSEIGINDGEVFTTDTHAVNAVVLNARGYHPVGEAMDQKALINYVKQATTDALAHLESAEVAWHTETVSGVKVIGERQIEAMCMLLDKAVKRAKKLTVSLFPILGVILVTLLLFL